MGDLLFCNEPIAAMPYYVESISLNIYSIEELCYYISTNVFLLDKGFMNEELCTWIEKEANLPKVAISLREIMHADGLLSSFVTQIICSCGYFSQKEINEIVSVIQQMEEKSGFECIKLRADKLMESKRYLSSVYEYKRILEAEDVDSEDKGLIGNVWHNLGTAYARLFLFKEAAACYEKAYKLNEDAESLKECLFSYRCMHDEDGFLEIAKKYFIDDMGICEIKNELSLISRCEETLKFETKLEEIVELKQTDKIRMQQEISNIILEWKQNYRKICRI